MSRPFLIELGSEPVREQRNQDDDRQRDADKPEKATFEHVCLLFVDAGTTATSLTSSALRVR
jgi:hypothetical protein